MGLSSSETRLTKPGALVLLAHITWVGGFTPIVLSWSFNQVIMDEERRAVVEFIEWTSKRVLCYDLRVDYDALYGRFTYYRAASPTQFAKHVFTRYVNANTFPLLKGTARRMYDSIAADLGADARRRCVQVCVEYAAIIHGNFKFVDVEFADVATECLASVQPFYDDGGRDADTTYLWLYEMGSTDAQLLAAICLRVDAGGVLPAITAPMKRTLYYRGLLTGQSPACRVYVDRGLVLRTLVKLRNAYQYAVFSGRHSVDELAHRDSLSFSLTKRVPFEHSFFTEALVDERECFAIACLDAPEYTLVLHDGFYRTRTVPMSGSTGTVNRHVNLEAYATALELISYRCGVGCSDASGEEVRVYCDRRLNHHAIKSAEGPTDTFMSDDHGDLVIGPVAATAFRRLKSVTQAPVLHRLNALMAHTWRASNRLRESEVSAAAFLPVKGATDITVSNQDLVTRVRYLEEGGVASSLAACDDDGNTGGEIITVGQQNLRGQPICARQRVLELEEDVIREVSETAFEMYVRDFLLGAAATKRVSVSSGCKSHS